MTFLAKTERAVTGKSKFSRTSTRNEDIVIQDLNDDSSDEVEANDSDYDTDLDIEEAKEKEGIVSLFYRD